VNILSNRFTFPSARVLANFLTKETGKVFKATTNLSKSPAIVWGNSLAKNETDLNTPELVKISSNKRLFSELLESNNIPCLKINYGEPQKFPVVVRTILTGSKGNGIVVCKDREEFIPYLHCGWTYWHYFKFELGVHILGGEIHRVFKKVSELNEPEEFPIKNAERGYHYSLVDGNEYPKLIPFIKQIYEVFPIQFTRLDVGWDTENKIYRAIESNSAPGLSQNENTLEVYGEFIINKLGL
jgi:hypothetical protein